MNGLFVLIEEENLILDLIDKINDSIEKRETLEKYLHLLEDLKSRESFKKIESNEAYNLKILLKELKTLLIKVENLQLMSLKLK